MPKEDRRRHAEAEVLKQQERRAVKSAGEQFDVEARWRQEQEAHGRRLFATAHGQDGAGPEAGASAGLLGLPPGYSIIGPSVPLEERRADMHARSQVRDSMPGLIYFRVVMRVSSRLRRFLRIVPLNSCFTLSCAVLYDL